MRAYWPPGSPCCCSGCRCCSCCGWRSGGSSDCCSRSPRAAPAGRGRARLPRAAGRRSEPAAAEDRAAQPPGVGVLGVRDPRPHALLHGPVIDGSGAPAVAHAVQAVAKTADIVLGQASPAVRQELEAQVARRMPGWLDPSLLGMERQASAGEIRGQPVAPALQNRPLVVEQGEVVDVADVAARLQDFFAEVIEAVEVDVGEKLAGQVADRQPAGAAIGLEQVVAGIVGIDTGSCGLEPSMMVSSSQSVAAQPMRRRRSRFSTSWSIAGK